MLPLIYPLQTSLYLASLKTPSLMSIYVISLQGYCLNGILILPASLANNKVFELNSDWLILTLTIPISRLSARLSASTQVSIECLPCYSSNSENYRNNQTVRIDRQYYKLMSDFLMSVIYSLVARQNVVLSDHSPHQGNFFQVALQLLPRVSLNSKHGRFVTAHHCFYVLTKQKFVFLVLVEQSYEMYIAIKFLEKIRDEFFNKYDAKKRNTANAHSLKNFKPTLESWMLKYNNKEEVDKFYMLKKELREVEEQALINMNLTIIRGQNIEILVHKSQDLANISYTLKETSTKVKNTMWWKSKKLLLGICTVVVAVVLVVVLVVLL